MSYTIIENVDSVLIKIDEISELGNEYRMVSGSNSFYIPKKACTLNAEARIIELEKMVVEAREWVCGFSNGNFVRESMKVWLEKTKEVGVR